MAYKTGIPGIPGLQSDGKGGVVIAGNLTATQHLDAAGSPIAVASYPGLTADGLTPAGFAIDGALSVGGDELVTGGIGLHGHAAQTTPRTLAQSAITAITDANAKTAVQAIANALADIGALTLT